MASTISWLIAYLPFVDQIGPYDRVVRYVDRLAGPVHELERPLADGGDLAAEFAIGGLDANLAALGVSEVLACAERPFETGRAHLDGVAVEVRPEDPADPLAECVVDAARLVHVDAEPLTPRDLEREHFDIWQRLRDGAGNLAVQLFLLLGLTCRHSSLRAVSSQKMGAARPFRLARNVVPEGYQRCAS